MSSATRKYATIQHPTIEALVGGHYRYKERAQALARFTSIAETFVLSKDQPSSTKDDPSVVFWIKGFEVTQKEDLEGFSGHFVTMKLAKRPDGLFTLTATKLLKPLTGHPQKKRPTSKHPNWGHPVMRALKRKKVYSTLEAAQAELELLHLEFPEVSIPGGAKLYIIIYEKREGIARPTHKILIEVVTRQEGGFILSARSNEKSEKPKPKDGTQATAEGSGTGYFASTEALRKANRRKRVTPSVVEVNENDAGKFSASEKERKKRKKKKQPPRVSASIPGTSEEAEAQARFRAAEEEREKRRRRRSTVLDETIRAKRDKKP